MADDTKVRSSPDTSFEHIMPGALDGVAASRSGATGNLTVIPAYLNELANAKPDDIQRVAASQLGLLVAYHEIVLAQSRRSFSWALIGAGVGLVFFLVAAGVAFGSSNTVAAVIPVVSGAVVEVIAGVVFFLYGKTAAQLGDFHARLETLQRYLLANSMCESLKGDERDKARADLIREIARVTPNAPKPGDQSAA